MLALLLVGVGVTIYWIFKYDDWYPNTSSHSHIPTERAYNCCRNCTDPSNPLCFAGRHHRPCRRCRRKRDRLLTGHTIHMPYVACDFGKKQASIKTQKYTSTMYA